MTSTITITLRLFAQVRVSAGAATIERQVPAGSTAGEVARAVLAELDLSGMAGHVVLAINAEYARPDDPLAEGDWLSLVPPVSGGAQPRIDVLVTDAPSTPPLPSRRLPTRGGRRRGVPRHAARGRRARFRGARGARARRAGTDRQRSRRPPRPPGDRFAPPPRARAGDGGRDRRGRGITPARCGVRRGPRRARRGEAPRADLEGRGGGGGAAARRGRGRRRRPHARPERRARARARRPARLGPPGSRTSRPMARPGWST